MAKRTEVTCQKCGRTKKASSFLPTYSKFFPFGTVDICTDCIEDMIDEENGSLNFISKNLVECKTLPENLIIFY